MSEYLAMGQIACDRILKENGEVTAARPGGAGFFGYTGVKLYTDSSALVTTTGENYIDHFGDWMQRNGASTEHIAVEADLCTCTTMQYRPDGSYGPAGPQSGWEHTKAVEMRGFMIPRASQLDRAADGAKGAYVYTTDDMAQWKQIAATMERTGLQVMWEINHFPRNLERIKRVLQFPIMWSLNGFEAEQIFGIPRENTSDMLWAISKITKIACYYRVGTDGAYMVTPKGVWHCPMIDPVGPSVDPTGCGNCSTGAAMYGLVAGHSLQQVLVMAAVAAGFNAAQAGPMPLIDNKLRAMALKAVADNMSIVKAVR